MTQHKYEEQCTATSRTQISQAGKQQGCGQQNDKLNVMSCLPECREEVSVIPSVRTLTCSPGGAGCKMAESPQS